MAQDSPSKFAASEAQKRKPSLDDARPDDGAKRHKGDVVVPTSRHDDENVEDGEDEDGEDEENGEDEEDDDDDDDGDEDEDEDGWPEERSEAGSDNGDEDSANQLLAGPGPHIFMCWAEAIISFVGNFCDHPYLVVKSTALEAWRKTAHLPKDKRRNAICDHMEIVKAWEVSFNEKDYKKPSGRLLKKAWDEIMREQREERAAKKGTGDDEECGWWYEVIVHQEKPADDAAALKITFDGGPMGTWWITGFAVTDKETHDAMLAAGDWTCSWFL